MTKCPTCGQALKESICARVLAAITKSRHEYSIGEISAISGVDGKALSNALGYHVRRNKLVRIAYGLYRKPKI